MRSHATTAASTILAGGDTSRLLGGSGKMCNAEGTCFHGFVLHTSTDVMLGCCLATASSPNSVWARGAHRQGQGAAGRCQSLWDHNFSRRMAVAADHLRQRTGLWPASSVWGLCMEATLMQCAGCTIMGWDTGRWKCVMVLGGMMWQILGLS